VRDAGALLDQLNEGGELLRRGPGQYKVTGVAVPPPAPKDSNAGSFFAGGEGGGSQF
jgi:DNA helicase MCM8